MGAHTTAEARRKIVARYRRSGLTQREFCEREGIKLGALRSWLYKRSRPQADGPRFIELTPSEPRIESRSIELHLGEVRVVLPTTIGDERLADLIVALERRARATK